MNDLTEEIGSQLENFKWLATVIT